MPPVTGIGSPAAVSAALETGHSAHGAPTTATPSFASALTQALGRPSGAPSVGVSSLAPSMGASSSLVPRTTPTTPSTGQQSHYIPLTDSGHPSHDFQQIAMGLRAYRQQIIASNIANADTPGYKAVDIDFQEALRTVQATANVPPMSLSTTSAAHLPGQSVSPQASIPLKYHVPSQGSIDGNTVEMDVERAKFAENAMMWQFATDRVSGHFKHEMEMLQNLK